MASFAPILKRARRSVEDCIAVAQKVVLPRYGATLRRFPFPLPPSAHATYMAHESGGRRHLRTKYPEVSLDMLTCRAGDDEVKRFNVDPLDPRSHVWAAQHAFWLQRAICDKHLRQYFGWGFDSLTEGERAKFLWLGRSVGPGCVRGLLRAVARKYGKAKGDIVGRLWDWLEQPNADTTPFDGSQTTDLVRLRFLVACIAVDAAKNGQPMVDRDSDWQCLEPPPRDGLILPRPRDFNNRIAYYCNQARREGPAPTGPWPKE